MGTLQRLLVSCVLLPTRFLLTSLRNSLHEVKACPRQHQIAGEHTWQNGRSRVLSLITLHARTPNPVEVGRSDIQCTLLGGRGVAIRETSRLSLSLYFPFPLSPIAHRPPQTSSHSTEDLKVILSTNGPGKERPKPERHDLPP